MLHAKGQIGRVHRGRGQDAEGIRPSGDRQGRPRFRLARQPVEIAGNLAKIAATFEFVAASE